MLNIILSLLAAFPFLITIGHCISITNLDYKPNFDCTGFYKNSNGFNYLFQCPQGLLFDENIKVCNWANAVNCNGQATTTTAASFSSPVNSPGNLVTLTEFSNAFIFNRYPVPAIQHYNYFISQAATIGSVTSKLQLAIFLAQIIWESDGLRVKRDYACYPTLGPYCQYSRGIAYSSGFSGQSYFGRGYMRLSWDYNYRAASQYLFGNPNTLLANPDLVASNEELSWATAFWFWRFIVIGRQFGPSVLNGYFGAATNALNGEFECKGDSQNFARQRFQVYLNVLQAFNINTMSIENGCYN